MAAGATRGGDVPTRPLFAFDPQGLCQHWTISLSIEIGTSLPSERLVRATE